MRLPDPLRRLVLVLLLGLTVALPACDSNEVDGTDVVVMTRNLYLGGDLFVLLSAQSANDVPPLVAQLYGSVVANDFNARAELIADEIEATTPDLIGLQEVSLYRLQSPSDYVTGTTTPNATAVSFDYLQILLDALAARGLNYSAVAVTENADVELPSTTDGMNFTDVRFTDRDVILARQGVSTTQVIEENFDLSITAPADIGGQTFFFVRGYNSVVASVDGATFTFINAHLEVDDGNPQGAALAQFAQANALLDRYAGDTNPKIIVGDFNSAADGSGTQIRVPGQGLLTTYDLLTNPLIGGSDGFNRVGSGSGFTCCYDPDASSGTLTSRIDLILTRGGATTISTQVVGTTATTPGGDFASDHAGVVATVRVAN